MNYENFSRKMGKRLALIRQEKKMTQAQLAREAGLSLKYVSMMESGTNPSVRTAMKVCEALGTSLAEIMELEGIGKVPGRKPAKLSDVQVDIPADDPQIKKLIAFIKKLDDDGRRKALKLIKTSFGSK